jgi:hypothetical protein
LVGFYYENGIGCSKNLTEAFRYYKLGSDKCCDAQYNLALCYIHGKGTEQNYKEAFKFLILATDNGNEDALDKFHFLDNFTLCPFIKKTLIEKAISQKESCPITFNLFTIENIDNIIVTNCGHCFELEGIARYLFTGNNPDKKCPMCNVEL